MKDQKKWDKEGRAELYYWIGDLTGPGMKR